jgi:hypothetical protein
MNHKKVNMFMVILFLAMLGSHAFPHWYINKSDSGFAGAGVSGTAVCLGDYVVDGAGYFLDSYANTLLFMKKLEWSGKDGAAMAEAAPLLDSALKSMETANRSFMELKRLADMTPYDSAVTDALRQFDYNGFRAAYNIDDKIFDRVRDYLGKGDIRSVYRDIVIDTETIIKRLKQVKTQVDAGAFPVTWDVWNLDRAYSDSVRFGQYVARVFDALGID